LNHETVPSSSPLGFAVGEHLSSIMEHLQKIILHPVSARNADGTDQLEGVLNGKPQLTTRFYVSETNQPSTGLLEILFKKSLSLFQLRMTRRISLG
jgi:hypothetical protein